MSKVIANIGLRDVRFNIAEEGEQPCYLSCDRGEEAAQISQSLGCDIGARHMGEKLTDMLSGDFQRVASRLVFPMLAPSLRMAIEIAGPAGDPVTELMLLATNQDPGTARAHYHNDTISLAGVVSQVLQKENEGLAVRVLTLTRSPHQHDSAYLLLQSLLPVRSSGLVFLVASGGIPAVNSAARELCLNRFDDRLRLLQPNEPSVEARRAGAESPVTCLPLRPFRVDRLAGHIQQLTVSYDYQGALGVLRREQAVRSEDRISDAVVAAVLEYAHARFNCDYSGAAQALCEVLADGSQVKLWHDTVSRASFQDFLWEMVETAEICLNQGKWGDFLWRVTSFVENAWRWWAEQLVPDLTSWYSYVDRRGRPVAPPGERFFVDKSQLQTHMPGLGLDKVRSFRDDNTVDPTRNLFRRIVDQQIPSKQTEQRTAIRLRRFEPLINLRNNALHAIKGVSVFDVAQAYDRAFSDSEEDAIHICRGVPNDMSAIYQKLSGGKLPKKTYPLLNEFVFQRLRRQLGTTA